MRRIAKSDIKNHVKAAVGQLTPAYAEAIWQQPVEQATGKEWYLTDEKRYPIKAGKVVKLLASVAVCLAVCFLLIVKMINAQRNCDSRFRTN